MPDPANTPTIQLDIISDVVCPWCIIGYKQFEKAVAEAPQPLHIRVRWQPFELNPRLPDAGQNLREHLMQKAGITEEQSRAARQQLSNLGESLGFQFCFSDEMRIHNTHRAHRLLHWAATIDAGGDKNPQTALKLALFEAYFSRGENVNDVDVLVSAAEGVGLPREEARAVVEEGRFADEVTALERIWRERDIRGVPAFIFNNRYAVLGAQDAAAFQRIFDRLSRDAA